MSQKLGIYWGDEAFSVIEVDKKGHILKGAYVPFSTPIGGEMAQDAPEDIKLTALIQKTVKAKEFDSTLANLALPAKDLIFRSFTIPWMQPSEVKNVVDFEATKYIPIALDELSYTYHAETITENGQKQIKILFVAIRKAVLQKYLDILKNAGIQVTDIEPDSVSLTRLLKKKAVLVKNRSFILVELGAHTGKLIVIDNEVVHFVREFQMPEGQMDTETAEAQLYNDIRMSIHFYLRQYPHHQQDKIIIFGEAKYPELLKSLTNEFSKPIQTVTFQDIARDNNYSRLGLMIAYGVTFREKKFSTKNFDLSERGTKILKAGGQDEGINYKTLSTVFGVCLGIIAAAFFGSTKMTENQKKRLTKLQNQQGKYDSLKKSDIDDLIAQKQEKLEGYKAIRTKSDIRFYLMKIPQLLPSGMWLNNFSISYQNRSAASGTNSASPQVNLNMSGYTYLENQSDQFRVTNNLVATLKADEEFASAFDNIDLQGLQQQKISNYNVTSFQIICQ